MITKKQRKEYQKKIGKYYTAAIRAYLEEHNVLSKSGKPYANSTIWHVFNGSFENVGIEKAFEKVANPDKESHLKTSV
jgi:hypothetical protein